MCIERGKVDFKSREVNCLKECALALNLLTDQSKNINFIEDTEHYVSVQFC